MPLRCARLCNEITFVQAVSYLENELPNACLVDKVDLIIFSVKSAFCSHEITLKNKILKIKILAQI